MATSRAPKKKALSLKAENIRKKAAKRTANSIKQTLEQTRIAAVVRREASLEDQEEAKAALEGSPELRERIALLVQKHKPAYTFLSPEEKAIIIELFHESVSRHRIADILNREVSTVSRFLARYQSTTTASRMYFEANADRLAHRVVKNANVDQSLEVLDRLDVLPKKDRREDTSGPRFNVVIGMPGAAATPPIPTQRAIEAARGAVTVDEE